MHLPRLTQSLIFGLFLASLVLADHHAEWENFKKKHGRKFRDADHEHARHKSFNKSLEFVKRHNDEAAHGRHTYTVGINEYSDLTDEERKLLNGFKARDDRNGALVGYRSNRHAVRTASHRSKREATHSTSHSTSHGTSHATSHSTSHTQSPSHRNLAPNGNYVDDLPVNSVNWVEQGYVTSVKNQGLCGACWTFSAAGAIEGLLFKTRHLKTTLSNQNLLDCSYPGTNGCEGGMMEDAFQYVIDNQGIASDAVYPYVSGPSQTSNVCSYSGPAAATVANFTFVDEDETALLDAVTRVGPISVAVDASPDGFAHYKTGIYTPTTFSGLDHGVLLVGFGTDNGQDYWLVKNSWGTTWGLDGYVKIARNANNAAGIASHAVYPTL